MKKINHIDFAKNLKSAPITTKVVNSSVSNDGKIMSGVIHNVLSYEGFEVAYCRSFCHPVGKPFKATLSSTSSPLWEVNHQNIVIVNEYNEEIELYELGDIIINHSDIEFFDLSVLGGGDLPVRKCDMKIKKEG